jgi:hypothetical protein
MAAVHELAAFAHPGQLAQTPAVVAALGMHMGVLVKTASGRQATITFKTFKFTNIFNKTRQMRLRFDMVPGLINDIIKEMNMHS